MSNKHIIILSILLSIIVAFISFVLGISIGVSSEQETFLKFTIPILGVIGNWVAGVGAIFAVFVALWLAEQQRKRDSENLQLNFSVFITAGNPNPYLAVSVTSNGNKPSKINSISVHSKSSKIALAIMQFDIVGHQPPTLLTYGEQATFILVPKTEEGIRNFVKENGSGLYKNLYLGISTSTSFFKTPFSSAVIEYLQKNDANK